MSIALKGSIYCVNPSDEFEIMRMLEIYRISGADHGAFNRINGSLAAGVPLKMAISDIFETFKLGILNQMTTPQKETLNSLAAQSKEKVNWAMFEYVFKLYPN